MAEPAGLEPAPPMRVDLWLATRSFTNSGKVPLKMALGVGIEPTALSFGGSVAGLGTCPSVEKMAEGAGIEPGFEPLQGTA